MANRVATYADTTGKVIKDSGSLLDASGNLTLAGTLKERGRTVPMGEWVAVPYAAGDFTSDGAAWTVEAADVTALRYTLIGKTMFLAFNLYATSLGAGTTTELRIKIPGGFLALLETYITGEMYDGAGWSPAVIYTTAGANYIGIGKIGSPPLPPNVVNLLYVMGTIGFEIQ